MSITGNNEVKFGHFRCVVAQIYFLPVHFVCVQVWEHNISMSANWTSIIIISSSSSSSSNTSSINSSSSVFVYVVVAAVSVVVVVVVVVVAVA